jgi:hypothetical protein
LILAACPPAAPVRTAAEEEVNRRRLVRNPQRLWPLLQAIRPPQVADLLEIGRPPQPLLRALVAEVLLSSPLLYNLCQFLGRMFLRDPAGEQTRAARFLVQATGLYYRTPQGTVDFPCRLYRHVLANLRSDDEALPSSIPPGFTAPDDDERQFLERCLLWLPEPDLERLYLQFYPRLTVGQIACVLQQADQTWTADQAVLRLEQAWQTVL